MKKLIYVALILLFSVGGMQAQTGKFTLDVQTGAINQKLVIVDKGGKIDSVISSNGRFHKEGQVGTPYKVSLYLVSQEHPVEGLSFKGGGFPVYIEPGNITVVATGDKLTDGVLAGTALNDDLYAYNKMRTPYLQKMEQLDDAYDQSQKKGTPIESKVIFDEYKVVEQKLKQEEIDFFHSHLHSLVSLDWLRSKLKSAKQKTEVLTLFNKMGKDVQQSEEGKLLASVLEKMQAVELHALAPDFTAKNQKGEDISLKSYRGRYVLVDFWASWCGPCRKENPNVLAAYHAFKDKNFTVLGVSLDNSKAAWEKAIEKDALPWEQVSDLKGWNSIPAALYAVRSIPSNFLVNPEGYIVAINLREEALHQKLGEILGE